MLYREEMEQDGAVATVMSGMMPRQYLSTELNAFPVEDN